MAKLEVQEAMMPSILDRLIDPESAGTAFKRGYGPEQMVVAVRRDLEELLNTRQSHMGLSPEYVELNKSIYAYGLPDLATLNAVTPAEQEAIGRHIESIITLFEPRLKDVRATMMDSKTDTKERTISFHIDARLSVDPAPEVAFDTVLQLSTGRYTVNQSS